MTGSTTTTALIVAEHGGPDRLTVAERTVPAPGPGEVQVRVAAAGVNFIDVYQRQGIYPIPTPFVLGLEGAGEVVAIGPPTPAAAPVQNDPADVGGPGSDAVPLQCGDQVAWAMRLGSATGLANFPAAQLVPVPAGLDVTLAAAAMLQGMTAHFLVNTTYAVRPGERVLVHAAAGGVGQLLIQMLVAKGAEVIATAGSPQKLAIAERLGARSLIDYSATSDVAAQVRTLTRGRGVDVVYDGVGKATFDGSLASLRPRGMLVLFGAASGPVPPFDLQRLNQGGSLFVTRPSLGHHVSTRAELLEHAGAVLTELAAGRLHVAIGGRWPLAEAAAAYAHLEGRGSTGKLLLLP